MNTKIEKLEYDAVINKVLGVLYGQAIGDAMGMPSELWPRVKVQEFFGYITDFLGGPQENEVAKNFNLGQFTDDTAQALVILDTLFTTNFTVDQQLIANNLIKWGVENNAFEEEIFGPSTKAALNAHKDNSTPEEIIKITGEAATNGSAMRISPIGTLFATSEIKELVNYVFQISSVTHSSDVAIAGASVIAAAVCAAVHDFTWDNILHFAYTAHDLGSRKGVPTYEANIKARIKMGLKLVNKYKNDDDGFLQAIYDTIGSGVGITESVPAAILIAYYSRDVKHCSILCANLGGDTDTIGAMATAICGAKNGYDSIDAELIKVINERNNVDLRVYGERITKYILNKK